MNLLLDLRKLLSSDSAILSTMEFGKGYPCPEFHGAEDRGVRGKKLAEIKKQVHGMLDVLTTAAKAAPPAVRKELEQSLATARNAHNVKDELDALQKAVPLLRKR